MARLPGVSSAPPTPCSARAAISVSTFGASPHSAEATREPDGADDEDPPPAEPVGQRAAEQDERGERQRVAVERPLQPGEVGAQVLADPGERDVDDGRVEHRQAGAEHRRQEHPAPRRLAEADLPRRRSAALIAWSSCSRTRQRPPVRSLLRWAPSTSGRDAGYAAADDPRDDRAEEQVRERGDAPVDQHVLLRVVLREQVAERAGEEAADVEDEVDEGVAVGSRPTSTRTIPSTMIPAMSAAMPVITLPGDRYRVRTATVNAPPDAQAPAVRCCHPTCSRPAVTLKLRRTRLWRV